MASNDTSGAGESSDNNIQVFIRIRPPSDDEPSYSRVVESDPSCTRVILQQKPNPRVFSFDFVADVDATQESIFSTLGKKVIDNCIAGYNGTIFAYGQTGSGKTFTMLGPSEDTDKFQQEMRGVIPRSFEYLYSLIKREKELHGDNKQFLCKCSFLEIYNEQIFDLLEPTSASLHLRESFKTGVYVAGLSEQVVSDAAEAFQVLTSSWMNRRVASTAMNRESSRSHAVFTLQIESKEKKGSVEHIRTSQLNLVDLAGSERQKDTQASGVRLKEAGSINKSLSNLGNVIMCLVHVSRDGKKRFIPYRDSKLTFLLRDSLGGNSKTSLIACVHAGHKCFGETLSTLQFAKRAKMIKNKAVLNENAHGNIQQLQAEIKALKEELRLHKSGEIPREPMAVSVEATPVLKEMFLQAMQLQQKTEMEKIELHDTVKELKGVILKKDKAMQTNKMIIKFRENNISRLESKLKGGEEIDTRMVDLQKENEMLKLQYEHHPQVAIFSLEIQQLKTNLKNLKTETGILANVQADRQKVQQLEEKYRELLAEQDTQSDEEMTTPQRTEAVSTATLEKLRSQVADLEAEVGELKQSLAEKTQSAEKKELYLSSELESVKHEVKELETVIAANATKNKLEKAAMNEMHMQTVMTITTPRKECYKLRNRTVVVSSPTSSDGVLDSTIPFEEGEGEEEGIMGQDEPESMAEQAQEALMEQIKHLQENNQSLDSRISEYEGERVKSVQQLSMLQSQLKQMEELLEREKQHSAELQEQMSGMEPKVAEAIMEKQHASEEIRDLRMVLASADKELKESKQKVKAIETSRSHDMEIVQSKLREFEIVIQQISKENEKLNEEKEYLEMSLETEIETRTFQEGLIATLEETLVQSKGKVKELEHSLQNAEMSLMDEKDHLNSLVNQLNSEGMEKDKEVLLKMEENSRLQTEFESLRNMVDAHEDSAKTLRRTINEKEQKISLHEKNLKQAEDKISQQYSRIEEDSNAITELQQRLENGQEQITCFMNVETDLNVTIDSLQKQLDVKEELIQTANKQRRVELEMANEDLKCLQSDVDDLKKEYEMSQEQLLKSQNENEVHVEDINKLKFSLSQKEEATVALSSKELELTDLTRQLEELQSVRKQRTEENMQLKTRLQETESKSDSLKTELERLRLSHQETLNILEKQKEEVSQMESRLSQADTEVSTSKSRLQQAETERDQIQLKMTTLFLDHSEMTRENQDLKETEERLTQLAKKDNEEKTHLSTELSQLQLILQQIQHLYSDTLCPDTFRIDDLVHSVKATKEEHKRLTDANSDLVSHNNHKQKIKYHEALKNENIQLKKDILAIEVKYKHGQEQLKDLQRENKIKPRVLKENTVPAHKSFLSGDFTKYQGNL